MLRAAQPPKLQSESINQTQFGAGRVWKIFMENRGAEIR
jgi:hypothetical protein